MNDQVPENRPLRDQSPRGDPPVVSLDRWFGRLLGMLGSIFAIALWLLAAEALFLACTH